MSFTFLGKPISDSVNAKNYGVKGDGSTNDTAAINALLSSSHKSIYFPTGTYIFTGTLVVPNGKKVYGDGANTIFKLGYPFSLTSYDWRPQETGHLTNRPYMYVGANCTVSDFSIYGDTTEPKDEMHVAVLVHGNNTVCENIRTNNINYFPEDIQSKVHPYGPIEFCPGFGMFIFGADNVTVRNCKFTNNGYQGIGTEDAENIVIDGCYIGDGFRTGIQIHRGSKRIVVSKCIVHNENSNKSADITFHGASGDENVDRVIISDCILGPKFGEDRLIYSISTIWGYEHNITIKGCDIKTQGVGIFLGTEPPEETSELTNVVITGCNIDATRRGVGVDGDYVVVTGNLIKYGTNDVVITGENKEVSGNLSIYVPRATS